MGKTKTHEDLARSDNVESGSDRAFGFVFATVLFVVGIWPLIDGGSPRWWVIIAALVLVIISFTLPQILAPFNRVWFLFGLVLHRIVTPLVMALLYYLTVTPTALIMRIFGKRPLPLTFDQDATSYWIMRDPPGPEPETMERQF